MREDCNLDKKPLVSIVTPSYNAEKYIDETIKSVLEQTYQNWEMLIVDDISTDRTLDVVKRYAGDDSRIKYFVLEEKGGASLARNKAIRESRGKYIAFLDADDVWKKDKLEKQVAFMERNKYDFSYHNYELIDDMSERLKVLRKAPQKISYMRALIGCSIGCLSAMYNADTVGRVQINRLDKRNDDALWFKILEKCKVGYLLDENLALYRVGNTSLSSGSKVKLLKYHYKLYREAQEYSVIVSLFFTCTNILIYFMNKKNEVKIM